MAKKAVTVYLPDDIINIIDNYKEEYKLKNRTIAVERIILEWNMLKSLTFAVADPEAIQIKKDYRKSKEDVQNEVIGSGLDNVFDDIY